MPDDAVGDTEFVKFWNEVLVPKFIKFKHVLVDGLTHPRCWNRRPLCWVCCEDICF